MRPQGRRVLQRVLLAVSAFSRCDRRRQRGRGKRQNGSERKNGGKRRDSGKRRNSGKREKTGAAHRVLLSRVHHPVIHPHKSPGRQCRKCAAVQAGRN
jgi:hypothetical protein